MSADLRIDGNLPPPLDDDDEDDDLDYPDEDDRDWRGREKE